MSDYSIPDQPARFAKAKAESNVRMLSTTFDLSYLSGLRVGVTGANRGLGLAISREIVAAGGKLVAIARASSVELEALNPDELILGVDVQNDKHCEALAGRITGGPLNVLINNAGYFYEPVEKILDGTNNYAEELKMIDICAVGPLRITTSLVRAGVVSAGCRVAMITSQGGSIAWRTTQNPTGGDYGHHMSKAAANMMSVLVAQELRSKGIPVVILHPGFNKTEMTAKYSHIWEIEGAVDSAVGAQRVLHEIRHIDMDRSGKFYNCEDGLMIPW